MVETDTPIPKYNLQASNGLITSINVKTLYIDNTNFSQVSLRSALLAKINLFYYAVLSYCGVDTLMVCRKSAFYYNSFAIILQCGLKLLYVI